jgi:hypothetical protein
MTALDARKARPPSPNIDAAVTTALVRVADPTIKA